MCLDVDHAHTKRLKARLKKLGKINAYKVVVHEKSCLPYRLRSMYHTGYTWHPHWNESGRIGPPIKGADVIQRGIHVFLRRDTACKNAGNSGVYRVVRVVCFAEDFIASAPGYAVFDKVWLSQEQYYCAGLWKEIPIGVLVTQCPEAKGFKKKSLGKRSEKKK